MKAKTGGVIVCNRGVFGSTPGRVLIKWLVLG